MQDHAVLIACHRHRDATIPDVLPHGLWVAFQRLTIAPSTRRINVQSLALMQGKHPLRGDFLDVPISAFDPGLRRGRWLTTVQTPGLSEIALAPHRDYYIAVRRLEDLGASQPAAIAS